MGLYFVLEALCEKLELKLENQSIIVQGFGNVGGNIAELLYNRGCKVLAVSDISTGIYCQNGVDVEKLLEWVKQGKILKDYEEKNYKNITNEELLTLECDILVPAAIENQITEKNANAIKSKIVLEGANGPTTPEADAILFKKGIHVVPDILANSGGVCVSYFEYIQDIHSYFWKLDRINEELKRIILEAFEETHKISQERNISLRTAAYIIAVTRIAKAIELRGIFP
jgi:glutamate dehydrogenase (NAD(P)+)